MLLGMPGKSCWGRHKNLNENSIGIELVNKGHQFGYTSFKKKQISSLIKLCKKLIKKYKINKKNILGHSDIAPLRKIDPGEKFPWKYLAKNKVGIWHDYEPNLLRKFRRTKVLILISYFVIVSVAIALVFVGDTVYPDVIDVNYSKFILGFQVIIAQLRFDLFFIMTLLPVTVGLIFLSKNKLKHADSILVLIFGTIIVSPILVTFTYHYEILPYRFIPLLVFFSIGVGMFFSKNSKIHV